MNHCDSCNHKKRPLRKCKGCLPGWNKHSNPYAIFHVCPCDNDLVCLMEKPCLGCESYSKWAIERNNEKCGKK